MEKWTRLLVVLATLLLLLAFVAVAVRLGLYIHHTLLLFSLGALVAYALDPLVEWLRHVSLGKGGKIPSREMSVAVVFVVLALLGGLAVWTLGKDLIAQVSDIQQHLPAYRARAIQIAIAADRNLAMHNIHLRLADNLQRPPRDVQALAARAGREVLPFLEHVFANLGEAAIVLLIGLYFLLFGAEMREKFNALLPVGLRERADLWETDVNRILGGFVRGQFVIALIIGAAAALGCLALGIHAWLLIGLFVIVASLIPVFGPYLGAVPAVAVALIGPTRLHSNILSAALILVWFTIINEIGSKVLYPKLVGAALGLHTVLVLFVLFAGLEVAGIVGVLFAAPLTALVIVSTVHLYRLWQDLPDNLLSVVARREGNEAKHEPLP